MNEPAPDHYFIALFHTQGEQAAIDSFFSSIVTGASAQQGCMTLEGNTQTVALGPSLKQYK